MKKIIRILLISALLVSGAFLVAPTRQAYANHMELTTNYNDGEPGSFFTITGRGWLEYSTVVIYVNGTPVGKVQTDITGSFTFQLSTKGAEEGFYVVTTDSLEPLSVRLWLDYDFPYREPAISMVIFDLPPDLALTMISLPFVIK